jgi:tetratricopeptide (TPR) repeat protein
VTPEERRAASRNEEIGHPEAEILAAYADRALSPAERQAVERHAAGCAECRDILADTIASIEDDRREERRVEPAPPLPFRRRRWALGVVTGLAAAAVLVLAVQVVAPGRLASLIGRETQPDVEELVAAFADQPNRLVEGRLSGGFPYGAPPEITRGAASIALAPGVRIAMARIEAAAAADSSVNSRWALGAARLGAGNVDDAIAVLTELARSNPANAALHSDLSAAYLARARTAAGTDDARNALAAADKALALSPGLPEALFNRALALETTQPEQAAQAWQAVAEREPDSPWAREALQRAGR